MLAILHTIWLKLNPQNICGMGGFIEAISLCLNLVPDDGFLPYSMPEVFNKTEPGPLSNSNITEKNLM